MKTMGEKVLIQFTKQINRDSNRFVVLTRRVFEVS